MPMADEKDRELSDALAAYFKVLSKASGRVGIGTEALMHGIGERVPGLGAGQISETIRKLLADSQKKAAETNTVDNALANAWFTEHWPEPRKCPVCAHTNWAMAPNFAHVPLELIGRKPVGTYQPVRSFPCVVVACLTCGNQLFFNANAMKLLPEASE
jgi:hypothetical protein